MIAFETVSRIFRRLRYPANPKVTFTLNQYISLSLAKRTIPRSVCLAFLALLSCGTEAPRDAATPERQRPVDSDNTRIAESGCRTDEFPLGVVSVDFFDGISNIEGTVDLCLSEGDTLTDAEVQHLRTEFEAFILENYIASLFGCGYDTDSRLEAEHGEALRRLNGALGRGTVLGIRCGLTFSESM